MKSIVIASLAAIALAAHIPATSVTINSNSAACYASADTSDDKLASLPENAVVEPICRTQGEIVKGNAFWYYIPAGESGECYIPASSTTKPGNKLSECPLKPVDTN